ncbi:MAG: hypothetical protein C0594_11780 [Marinilabiliales bacterium]|nr:MAG: hypothetical protein C0594_11780 [Marinilabiliales bacterium]
MGQSISNVSPSSANVGDNISVDMTLSGMTPPTDVMPASAEIGSYSGANVTRSGDIVTADFDFSSASQGIYDVSVTFPGPSGDISFTMTSGFTINGSGSTEIIFVDGENGSDTNDGSTWANAKQTVQSGIDACSMGEVWIKQGTYFPTNDNNRGTSINLKAGVTIYGGFAGTETSLNERNWQTNPTILSGDIGALNDISDNAYHIVTGTNLSGIDGFYIMYGNANGELANRFGAGIYMEASSPQISNCQFENNYAEDGAAIYVFNDATPSISDCTFINNNALLGGAIVCRVGGAANITNCYFENNFAEWRGGALFVDYGAYDTNPVYISGCTFVNNSTNGNGGAFYCDDLASQYQGTYIEIENCTFTGNTAQYRGGGMSNFNQNIFITISNCEFSGNSAGSGGNAIANDYLVTGTISGCTFNTNQDVDSDSSCTITIN